MPIENLSSNLTRHVNKKKSILSISIFVFLALVTFLEYVIYIESERLNDSLRSYVVAQASAVRARLEGEMSSTLYLAKGIGGYASAHDALDEKAVNIVLRTVYGYGRHLRNIGMAPKNVLLFTYPIKTNEKAIGLRYEDLPKQWPAVKRAIDTANTILAGPVKLIQGGNGLISRTPVFLPDGKYWGMVSLVIDSDSLFTSVGLLNNTGDIEFGLRGKDGKGSQGDIIIGKPEIFNTWSIRHTIPVPGGSWELAAAPAAGWGSSSNHLIVYRVFSVAISALIALLVYLVLCDGLRIRDLATHDHLTDLPNRRFLIESLSNTIKEAEKSKQSFFIFCIDLNGFKPVNDKFGHSNGDKVLILIAERLRAALNNQQLIARVGGDEFIALLPDCSSKEQANDLAKKIVGSIEQTIDICSEHIHLGASIGISQYPNTGKTVEDLLTSADQAMYVAKKMERDDIYFIN